MTNEGQVLATKEFREKFLSESSDVTLPALSEDIARIVNVKIIKEFCIYSLQPFIIYVLFTQGNLYSKYEYKKLYDGEYVFRNLVSKGFSLQKKHFSAVRKYVEDVVQNYNDNIVKKESSDNTWFINSCRRALLYDRFRDPSIGYINYIDDDDHYVYFFDKSCSINEQKVDVDGVITGLTVENVAFVICGNNEDAKEFIEGLYHLDALYIPTKNNQYMIYISDFNETLCLIRDNKLKDLILKYDNGSVVSL